MYERCSRIQDTHHLGDAQWDYARELTRAATADTAEISKTEAFLALNEQIYNDAGKERPKHPGSSDHYRKREYLVDRQRGTWTVDTKAQQAVAARFASGSGSAGSGTAAEPAAGALADSALSPK